MTNQTLYKIFEKHKKEHNITYRELSEKLELSQSTICEKLMRLKRGLSVHTKFLIDLEDALDAKIFFK